MDSAEKAYWFGFLMADGCIIHTNRIRHLKTMDSVQDRYYLQLSLSSVDQAHVAKFKQCIQSSHPIREYACADYSQGFYSRIIIEDRHIFDSLETLGMTTNKSLTVVYPNIPALFDAPFIRGYFDGNGCVSYNASNNLWEGNITSTYEMLAGIFQRTPFNADKKFLPKQRHPEREVNNWTLRFGGNQQCLNVLEWMYAGSNELTRLDRKYDKYIELAKANGRLPQ